MGEALSTSGSEKLAERAAPARPPQVCSRSDDLVGGVPGIEAGVPLRQGPFGAAVATEARLGRYLSERRAELSTLDAEADALLGEPLTALALRGGRRIRACFVWLGWHAAGSPPGRAEPAALAAAVELLQLCALVHDDIMDASRTRRGDLSLHEQFAAYHRTHALSGDPVRYGQARALLAGDLALLWAEDLYRQALSDLADRAATDAVWRAMRTEMVAGQNLDMVLQAEQSASTAAALRVAELKTARYSVERPLHLGATAAGADAEVVRALRAFGRRVGVAFQLRDDLLGVFGDPAKTGKPCGDDLREGKRTFLLNLAVQRASSRGDEKARKVLHECVGSPGMTDSDIDRVREVLLSLGAPQAVEQRIIRLVDEGVSHLSTAAVPHDVSLALADLARQVAAG